MPQLTTHPFFDLLITFTIMVDLVAISIMTPSMDVTDPTYEAPPAPLHELQGSPVVPQACYITDLVCTVTLSPMHPHA